MGESGKRGPSAWRTVWQLGTGVFIGIATFDYFQIQFWQRIDPKSDRRLFCNRKRPQYRLGQALVCSRAPGAEHFVGHSLLVIARCDPSGLSEPPPARECDMALAGGVNLILAT